MTIHFPIGEFSRACGPGGREEEEWMVWGAFHTTSDANAAGAKFFYFFRL